MTISPKKRKVIEGRLLGKTKEQAMLDAGYSPSYSKTRQGEVFNDPDVMKEIERRQNISAARNDITLDWINNQLKTIAEANLGDLVVIDELGNMSMDYSRLTPELRKALQGVVVDEVVEGRGPNKRIIKRIKVNIADKLRALDLLTRFNGLSKEKTVVEIEGDLVERLQRGRSRVAKSEE